MKSTILTELDSMSKEDTHRQRKGQIQNIRWLAGFTCFGKTHQPIIVSIFYFSLKKIMDYKKIHKDK